MPKLPVVPSTSRRPHPQVSCSRAATPSPSRWALAFVNAVGAIAEAQGHHPDVTLAWGKAGVKIWTHKINGLTESDFILAAKIDTIKR